MQRFWLFLLMPVLMLSLPAPAAHAANLLTNADFDSDASGWSAPGIYDGDLDVADDPGSGSLRIENAIPMTSLTSVQRVDVSGPTALRASGCIRVEPGQSGSGYAQVDVFFYAGSCASPGGLLSSTNVHFFTFSSEAFTCGEVESLSLAGDACVETALLVVNEGATGSIGANFDAIFVPEPGATSSAIVAAAMCGAVARKRAADRAAGASRSS